MACVRQTDAWCRPGGSPAGTLCAPAGLVRRGGSEGSGSGRSGGQSGWGRHIQNLKKKQQHKQQQQRNRGRGKGRDMRQLYDDTTKTVTDEGWGGSGVEGGGG